MMVKLLIKRLSQLNVLPPEKDFGMLSALLDEAKLWLLAETAQEELPEALIPTMIDIAAGKYLLIRKSTGELESFDFEPVVRQISQGDTSVAYAVSGEHLSPFDTLVGWLTTPSEALLRKWRRMRW